MKKILFCSFFLMFLIGISGCKEKAAELSSGMKKFVSKKPQIQSPAPGIEPQEAKNQEYSYNPIGKPDPFQPFVSEKSVKKVSRGIPGVLLSDVEVEQLTLTGIILSKDPTALVQDSAGKGYILHLGTKVGTRAGVVTSIRQHEIVVTEKVRDYTGKLNQKSRVLKTSLLPQGES